MFEFPLTLRGKFAIIRTEVRIKGVYTVKAEKGEKEAEKEISERQMLIIDRIKKVHDIERLMLIYGLVSTLAKE